MHRHAFLIMAHNNWYTLEKLIQIIDAPWNDIYLHIDSKSKDFNKNYFLSLPKNAAIHLTKRHNVTWGNESQIKAEMELFKTAFRNGPYSYYHFLSGSDLPLINAKAIRDFFEDKKCNYLFIEGDVSPYLWRLKNYINVFRAKWLSKEAKKRLNILSEIYQYKMKINRLIWLQTKYPILGKGHNWCDLTQAAVAKLIAAKNDIRRFTRFTHCSDEMYKQIVLLNQPEKQIGAISTLGIRYIVWDESKNHPRILTMKDYDSMMAATSRGCVFARKFDADIDRSVIDRIFNQLTQ